MRIGLIFALAIFGVAGILGSLIGASSLNQLRARIGQSLATDAVRVAERLNAEMAARTRELALLAALDPLRDLYDVRGRSSPPSPLPLPLPLPMVDARVQAMLDSLKTRVPAYAWIGVTDPNGRVLAATDAATVGTDVTTRGWQRARPGGAKGEADVNAMGLDAPVRAADGTVVGVIVAKLMPLWMNAVAETTLTPDEAGVIRRELFVVSAHDVTLLGPPGTVGETLAEPVVSRARAGFVGWDVEHWPTGDYLVGSALATGEGPRSTPGSVEMRWTVLVRERASDAFAPAYELRRTILEIGVALALGFATVGWLIAGWITAPIKQIVTAAERLRRGDVVELPRIRGPAEIASLSASLRALVATLMRKQLALDELEEIALHDPLTGLLNRHGLRIQLQGAMREVRAEGAALLVFIADLDGFKSVNDTLGHAVGDRLLRIVAARLRQSLRPGDIVARLGGDEFVIALRAYQGMADVAARSVARRALAAVTSPCEIDGQIVRVGCSLGGACWPDHALHGQVETLAADAGARPGLDVVIAKADAALYAVKRAGKGRILIHGDLAAAA